MQNLMSTKRGVAAIAAALGLALFAALPTGAQATPPPQPSQPQQPAAGQAPPQAPGQNPAPAPPPVTPPVNKEEEDAYKAFFDLTPQQGPLIISQGEDFLAKYPSSRYRPSVFSRLVAAYLNAGQADKLVATGQKALAETPDNLEILAVMSSILPRTVDARSLDSDQKLSEAERYARHAIELTSTITKPDGMTEDQFALGKREYQGLAHTGLGLVLYMRGNTAASVEEFDQATKLDPTPDPLAFYLLGDGDRKLSKFSDASAAFDACAKPTWAWQDRCKKFADDTKKLATAPPAAKP